MQIIFTPGLIAVCGDFSDIAVHRHHALQMVFSPANLPELTVKDRNIQSSCVLIAENTPHRLRGENCLLLLIEPESHVAELLHVSWLQKRDSLALPPPICQDIVNSIGNQPFSWRLINNLLEILMESPCLERHLEDRIQTLVHWIDANEKRGDLHRVNLRQALDVVHLSESRFLHLFSEQQGITWRRYLLWRRLLSAISQAISGRSLTESAHHAGFSDSAHFSRTFRVMFGISPKKVMQNSRFIQVS